MRLRPATCDCNDDELALLVRDGVGKTAALGAITGTVAGFGLQMLIDGQYAEWLWAGLLASLKLLGLCLVMALQLGFVIAMLRTVPFAPLRGLGATYIEVFRNICCFGILPPELLPDGMRAWLYARNVEFSAAIALTLCGGLGRGHPLGCRAPVRGRPCAEPVVQPHHALDHPAAILPHRGSAADQSDAEPVEEHLDRNDHRRGRVDVPVRPSRKQHLPQLANVRAAVDRLHTVFTDL